MKIALSVLFSLGFGFPAANLFGDTVWYDFGIVKGTKIGDTVAYYNIPFAQPPVGKLRFQPPKPFTLFGYRDARQPGKECLQKNNQNQNQTSEDCLQLNVYAPKNAFDLPVLVFVYGGGFDSGSSLVPLYNGTFAAERSDIVVVTFNYRVGPFGFLSGFKDSQEPNVGLLDQKLAFEWVRKNIKRFGGNPNQITAMGQSAGAISIGAHLLANNGNQKLFDRAVLLSGGPLLRYATLEERAPLFNQVAEEMGCIGANALNCLRFADAFKFNMVASKVPYGIVDGGNYVRGQALPALYSGKFSKVPLLIQTTKDEGTFFALQVRQTRESVQEYIKAVAPFLNETALERAYQLYPIEQYKNSVFAAGDFFGDLVFQCTAKLTSEVYTAAGVSVFNSAFNHLNKINFFGISQDVGVFHGADLPFLFLIDTLLDPNEIALSKKIHDTFARFIKGDKVLDSNWPTYGNGNRFDIENQVLLKDLERTEKCDFIISSIFDGFRK